LPKKFTVTAVLAAAVFAVAVYALAAPFKHWIDHKIDKHDNEDINS